MLTKNFRITVSLKHFYKDFRSIAKIFVTEKMKRVCDLEEHIGKIFSICNFYLAYDNQYLPSLEDIGIISPEEVLTVMPKSKENQNPRQREGSPIHLEKSHCKEERKKKKKHKETIIEVPKLRKKKKSKHTVDERSDNFIDLNVRGEPKRKHESDDTFTNNRGVVIKKYKSDVICLDLPKRTNIVKNVIVHSSAPTNIKETTKDSNNRCKPVEVIEIKLKPSLPFINCNGSNETSRVEQPPKKNSSVGEAHLLNKDPEKPTENVDTSDTSKVVTTAASVCEISDALSAVKLKLEASMPEINDDFSETAVESEASLVRSNSGNRKRKRTRKRKTKIRDASPIIDVESVYSYKPPVTIAAPSLHIKFEDSELKADAPIEEQYSPIEKNSQEPDHDYIKKIDTDNAKIDLPESVILQSPLMDTLLPKLGDFISFQVLHMSKDYNPEISKFIVGKVLNFDEPTQEVHMQLISGADQCEEPNGKFCLETEEKKEETLLREKSFSWPSLIKPRLLFP